MPLAPGTRLGPYEILSSLGAGGMGEVYLAADKKLNRRIAIKVLSPGSSNEQTRLGRFLREARLAGSLSHPNIVTIFDFGEHEGLPFLAMEWVEGQSLRKRVAEGPLDLALALRVARQVVEALVAAHAAGIIHRDIKPENIMLTAKGDVKVLDFGLAREDPSLADFTRNEGSSCEEFTTVTNLTVAGTVVGTLRYMSPEQLRGHAVDARSDLFGVGILLYEMLTGHPPFAAPTWADFASHLLSGDPQPFGHWNVAPPPAEVEQVIAKCLAKNPAERYQSASELAASLALLERAVEPGTVSTRGLSPSAASLVAAHRPKQTKRWVLAALALLTALGAAAYFYRSRPELLDSVAVLPFLNTSGDSAVDYIAEGLAGTLRQELSRLKGMTVPPAGPVEPFRGPAVSAVRVARQLHASAVLTGTIEAADHDLRLDVVLTRASSGFTIWTQSYQFPRTDSVRVADRLWIDTAYQLGRNREAGSTRRSQPSTPEAYDLYLKAQSALARRGRQDVQQAVRLFQEATEKDRSSGLAYAGLAEAYVVLANFGAQPPVTVLPQAKEASRRAIELDPTLADAHLSYAITLALSDFDWTGAERSFRRSIELDPGSSRAHSWFALASLVPLKRFEEASIEMQRAVDLDPGSLATATLQATALYMGRRYDEAILILNRIKAAPFQGVVGATTAFTLDAKGQAEQAIRLLSDLNAPGFEPVLKSVLAYSYAVAGKRHEAERLAGELGASYQKVYNAPCSVAAIYVPLHEFDSAMSWLHECSTQGDLNLRFLGVDARWDPLRSDPRFQELVKRLALP